MIRLERYLQMQDEILLINVEITSLRQTKGLDYDSVRVQSAPSDPMGQLIGRIEKLEKKRERLWHLQQEIIDCIDSLANKRYAKILGYRYIVGMTVYEISEALDVSERWTRTLIRKAEERYYETARN